MNLLFLCGRYPYPPHRGDTSVAYHRIKHLAQRHSITLLAFRETAEPTSNIGDLATYCSEVHTVPLSLGRSMANMALRSVSAMPLQVSYYRSREFARRTEVLLARKKFDLIYVSLSRMAPYVLNLQSCPRVVDMIDALSLNMQRRAEVESWPKRWLYREEYRRMRRFEQKVCSSVDQVIVVSEQDRQHLAHPNVACIPIGIDPLGRRTSGDGKTVVFSGNFGYYPNGHGASFFLREVMPRLVDVIPDIRVRFIGMNPTAEMRNLADPYGRNVEITGFVHSVTDELRTADVAICPLLTGGSGMHLKVLEAMACGLPIVASPLVTGFDVEMVVAGSPEQWTAGIHTLLSNREKAATMAEQGLKLVESKYSWRTTTDELAGLFEELIARRKNGRRSISVENDTALAIAD